MGEKPCICIFSALYNPSVGGVEIFTENLARTLAAADHRVVVITSNTHDLPSQTCEDGVEVIRLPCKPLMGGRLPLPDRNGEFMSLIDEIEALPIEHMLINARFYPHSRIGVEMAERKRIKPVLLDHGSAHLTLGHPLADAALRAYEHWMTWRIKRHQVDAYGISQASAHWLDHFDIIAKGTINNALEADAFIESAAATRFRAEHSISDDALLVAFTGRLVPEKGVSALLAAAELLHDRQDIHFLIAGDGPLQDEVGIAGSNVHALGRLPRDEIAGLLLESDVFCMPTRSEGFSTSLLEAAVCGCAPIITDVGGVEELILNESYGIVLPDASPQAIAEAILRLSDDAEACKTMAMRIQRHATETFTWEKTAQTVMDAFKRAQLSQSQ